MEAEDVVIKQGGEKEITLPKSGKKVVLRDPFTLRIKDRKKVYEQTVGKKEIMQSLALVDGVIAMIVKSWEFDLMIPSVKIEVLGELEFQDYDFLVAEAREAEKLVFGTTIQDTPENEADADSPFGNSVG